MSDERNRQVARRVLEAIEEGRPDALEDVVAEDVLDHAGPDPGAGREGVKRALTGFRTVFPDVRLTVEDELATGDRVVQRVTVRGTHQGPFLGVAATGRTLTWQVMHWWRLEDGRVAEHWSIADLLSVLKQLGAVPGPGGEPAA